MLEYKGYIAEIKLDESDEYMHGEVINIQDVITFKGRTLPELNKALKESIDVYLDFCKSQGRAAEKPFSGNFLVRTTPENHRELYYEAKKQGISANKLANNIINLGLQEQTRGQKAYPINESYQGSTLAKHRVIKKVAAAKAKTPLQKRRKVSDNRSKKK